MDGQRLANVRILVADDNITNRHVAIAILRKIGLKADAVADGVAAVTALRRVPYDLVLMDVQMPEMDGFEATRLIRDPSGGALNRAVPIIAMTAHAMQGVRNNCLAAGMDDYISKPVTPAAVSEMMRKWLAKIDIADKSAEAPPLDAPPCPAPAAAVAASADPAAAIFDEASMLERLMSDRDLAREIACAFLDDIPKRIAAIRGCLDAGDLKGAERQAHTIKGASANVSGDALAKQAAKLERAGKAGDSEAVRAGLGELLRQFEQLKQVMERSSLFPTTPA
jgi:two-component system sensor histidine kinase/response regulator